MIIRAIPKFLFFLATLIIVCFSLLPFIWFFITSLKTEVEVTAIPPTIIPSGSLDFYRSGIEHYNLLHFVKNSILISGTTTIITLLLAIFAGYALARLRLPFKGVILGSLLAVSMFPQISIAGPVWRILQALG